MAGQEYAFQVLDLYAERVGRLGRRTNRWQLISVLTLLQRNGYGDGRRCLYAECVGALAILGGGTDDRWSFVALPAPMEEGPLR